MATAIKMENGAQNGSVHTNHDRDTKVNGIGSGQQQQQPIKPDPSLEKDKDKAAVAAAAAVVGGSGTSIMNGGFDGAMDLDSQPQPPPADATSKTPSKMNELPLEIQEITDNFIPISHLLSRLAQKSHNSLQERIVDLSRKAIPTPTVNGNTDTHGSGEDTSLENLEKKKLLLNFVQEEHINWLKTLVITEWSKKAGKVSKLIDLQAHFVNVLRQYDESWNRLAELKRDLTFARLPSPDLKTALQVLSQGDAPWMPDLGYIEPQPLSAREQLKWVEDLNTLLSIRLSLNDHDKIPYHFREYSVQSGRVTFKVKGEFEVDLTMADEDFEKQLWFIDFRFLFTPAPSELSDGLRAFLEVRVNEVLAVDGLAGCYNFLHEFVLTHKINELRRQANELRRGRWVDTLKVEPLNRALAIQYWESRFSVTGLKSWIIIGVHSAKRPNAAPHPKFTSHLSLRWFRDNKEIKDIDVPFDAETISAEDILMSVIAKHIEHIFTTIHTKLMAKPRFAHGRAHVGLHISATNPMESLLEVQLTHLDNITAKIDPITGLFSMGPHSRIVASGEQRLNFSGKDPADEGITMLDSIRCRFALDEIQRRGKSCGWIRTQNAIKLEDVRPIINSRENLLIVWFKRPDWDPKWQVMANLSLSGDRWWLVELSNNNQSGVRIRTYSELPLSSGQPNLEDPFFSNFTTLVAGIISHITDMRELGKRKKQRSLSRSNNPYLPPGIGLPAINVRLSQMLPSQSPKEKGRKLWAADFVRILFKGVEPALPPTSSRASGKNSPPGRPEGALQTVAQARLFVTDRSRFSLLKGKVDHDVAFNPRTGQFSLDLRADVGHTVIDMLEKRLRAIERLVGFLEAIRRQSQGVRCESVTLRKLVFTYGDPDPSHLPPAATAAAAGAAGAGAGAKRWKVVLDLVTGKHITVELERGNPHLRVLDYLTRVANDPLSFESLPYYLAMTLPLHRGLERLEDAWAEPYKKNAGALGVFPRSLDWLALRFTLPGPAGAAAPRQLNLDIRIRNRRGQVWWHIWRPGTATAAGGASSPADDEFDKVLRKIWDGRGKGWKGVGSGAVALPFGGIEECLAAVDTAVKDLVKGGPAAGSLNQQQQQQQRALARSSLANRQAQGPGSFGAKASVVDLTS